MPYTKSLKGRKHQLSEPAHQLKVLNQLRNGSGKLPAFKDKLKEIGLYPFRPLELEILQINVGYMCNLTCSHCHVDAGPDRKEIMPRQTMQHCLDAIDQSKVNTVDLTGGAPEMHPDFKWFVQEVSRREAETIVRSNLTILVANKKFRTFSAFMAAQGVCIIASLPCYTPENTDKQRGNGVFKESIEALQLLNKLGYGKQGSGLKLHLVYNPIGAHLPPSQEKLKADYKRELKQHFGVVFNDLYTITNLPIARFLESLYEAGNLETYMHTLVNAFNPAAAKGVMCRNTLSVGWDGRLYDCDFNQMLELGTEAGVPGHIKDFDLKKLQDRRIRVNQHCYGCTAGAGSSCQGAVT